MLRPILLALAAAAAVSAATDLDAFEVPAFDFAALHTASPEVLQALQADGIIALKNIPLYADLRATYLEEATKCALAASVSGENFLQHKTLQDGTERFTISTTSGKELATAADDTRARCPGYVNAYRSLSELVELAVAALGKSLDATPFQITSHTSLSGSDLLTDSVHLDHFHAYEASPSAVARDEELLSLELHTDNGMLIAMTAPKYFDVSATGATVTPKALASTTYESGLLIENRAGKLVKPTLKEDELVLMVGAGFQEWIRTTPSLRAVPHAMKYPRLSAGSDRLIRAWFGKMMLMSLEERMLNVGMTFGEFAKTTQRYLLGVDDHHMDHESGFASLACPHGRRLHENDKACVVKQCFPKPGKDPELPCSIQCNMSPTSRPGADRICEENCECTVKPSNTNATYCWMLCVEQLPEDVCGSAGQRCKTGVEAPYILDQAYTCNATANSTEVTTRYCASPTNGRLEWMQAVVTKESLNTGTDVTDEMADFLMKSDANPGDSPGMVVHSSLGGTGEEPWNCLLIGGSFDDETYSNEVESTTYHAVSSTGQPATLTFRFIFRNDTVTRPYKIAYQVELPNGDVVENDLVNV